MSYDSRIPDEEAQRVDSEVKSEADAYSDGDQQQSLRQQRISAGKEDPFGDESNSDVKYKTMTWW
jgi:hypothetical protein